MRRVRAGVSVAVAGAAALTLSSLALSLLALSSTAAAQPVFEDHSAALPGPHVYDGGWEHFVGGGVAVFDCNGDDRPDLFAAGGENPARAFVNVTAPGGALAFVDAGGDGLTGVTGAWPLDIDGDGHLDLAVMRVGANAFLRGDGACGFVDATADWGVLQGDGWSTAFSATWEPGAAWPTLAVGNYVDRAAPDGPFGACDANLLYRPFGRGFGPPVRLAPGFCTLSALFSDWQRTGRAELRLSNDRHYYVRGGYEQMWRLDPLRERGPADGWRRVSLWGMGIASRDITGNGFPDVMLTSMGDQLLQFNDGDGFRDAPYATGTAAQRPHVGDDGRPSTGWHAEWGDVDNDGRADLFIAKGNVDQMPTNAMADPDTLLMQQADGSFREVSHLAGVAGTDRGRGAALADLDGDGRLDLVVVNRRAPMRIWRNVTTDSGNWLALEPRMGGANTRAVGAWVEVRTAAGVQRQEVTVGGGHGGGQAGPLHFGLGAAEGAEVRVIWPGGTASDWVVLAANRRHRLWPAAYER